VEDQIGEKLFRQLLCLPQTSLLVDVKELGYENGAVATMDLLHQIQVRSYSCAHLTSAFNFVYFLVEGLRCAYQGGTFTGTHEQFGLDDLDDLPAATISDSYQYQQVLKPGLLVARPAP